MYVCLHSRRYTDALALQQSQFGTQNDLTKKIQQDLAEVNALWSGVVASEAGASEVGVADDSNPFVMNAQ